MAGRKRRHTPLGQQPVQEHRSHGLGGAEKIFGSRRRVLLLGVSCSYSEFKEARQRQKEGDTFGRHAKT